MWRKTKLYQFDPRVMTGGCGEAPVARQQGGVKRLSQRHIDGVIGRQIVPQVPHARQQEIVRISPQGEVGEVGQRETAACAVDFAVRGVAPDDLSHFDIEQMRRMQRLPRGEKPILDGFSRRRAEQGFKQGRGVDDNHRPSRSARTMSAGGTEGVISDRLRKRARISSSVGRSVTWRISLSR